MWYSIFAIGILNLIVGMALVIFAAIGEHHYQILVDGFLLVAGVMLTMWGLSEIRKIKLLAKGGQNDTSK